MIGIAEYYVGIPHVTRFRHGRNRAGSHHRLAHVHRQPDRGGKTAGNSAAAARSFIKGQNIVSLSVLAGALSAGDRARRASANTVLFPIMVVVALIFGVLLVTPIGGADMPTVISLLNSYAGFSAALLGFVLNSKVLVVAGALDGSSGFILSVIMCKAMNRSFTNVMFGAFGQVQATAAGARKSERCAAPRRGSRWDSCCRQQSGHRSRIRHGRGAGAAQSARTL